MSCESRDSLSGLCAQIALGRCHSEAARPTCVASSRSQKRRGPVINCEDAKPSTRLWVWGCATRHVSRERPASGAVVGCYALGAGGATAPSASPLGARRIVRSPLFSSAARSMRGTRWRDKQAQNARDGSVIIAPRRHTVSVVRFPNSTKSPLAGLAYSKVYPGKKRRIGEIARWRHLRRIFRFRPRPPTLMRPREVPAPLRAQAILRCGHSNPSHFDERAKLIGLSARRGSG